MKYSINDTDIVHHIKQNTVIDTNLYHHQDIFQPSVNWYECGYTKAKLDTIDFEHIIEKTTQYIQKTLSTMGYVDPIQLDKYHQLINSSDEHLNVLNNIGKCLHPEQLGIDIQSIPDTIKKVCKIEHQLDCKNVCDIRIFRPFRGFEMDNNPLHRDSWIPIINNSINIYIPIIGNNDKSSLSLIPGSHLWEEKSVERTDTNAYINGVQYGLPAVSSIHKEFQIIRPELRDNEILIFSSHLIHGGAVNLNSDTTRISIEMRFWTTP